MTYLILSSPPFLLSEWFFYNNLTRWLLCLKYLNTFLLLTEFNLHFYIWHIGVPYSSPALVPTYELLPPQWSNHTETKFDMLALLVYNISQVVPWVSIYPSKISAQVSSMNSSLTIQVKLTILPLHCHYNWFISLLLQLSQNHNDFFPMSLLLWVNGQFKDMRYILLIYLSLISKRVMCIPDT